MTFTIYDTVKNYLERHSYARERRFKDKALVELIKEKYGEITEDKLIDFARDFTSYDRVWRLVLSENPDLRGNDYDDKAVYEQKAQQELGYEAWHDVDVKRLNKLTKDEMFEMFG